MKRCGGQQDLDLGFPLLSVPEHWRQREWPILVLPHSSRGGVDLEGRANAECLHPTLCRDRDIHLHMNTFTHVPGAPVCPSPASFPPSQPIAGCQEGWLGGLVNPPKYRRALGRSSPLPGIFAHQAVLVFHPWAFPRVPSHPVPKTRLIAPPYSRGGCRFQRQVSP